jgi:hypothetical protein
MMSQVQAATAIEIAHGTGAARSRNTRMSASMPMLGKTRKVQRRKSM